MMRSRRADFAPARSARFFVYAEGRAGSDFRAAEHGEVELVRAECANHSGEVISSQA